MLIFKNNEEFCLGICDIKIAKLRRKTIIFIKIKVYCIELQFHFLQIIALKKFLFNFYDTLVEKWGV